MISYRELTRNTGDVVRYGPNRYSFRSPSAISAIYGHGAKFPKSSWYSVFRHPDPSRWTIFSDQNIKRHNENRRQYSSAYSMSSMVHYESYVDECAGIFYKRLMESANAGTFMDMGHWFQCYAFDVIGMITYSKRIGFLDSGEDVGNILKVLNKMQRYGSLTGIFAWIHPYMFALNQKLGGSKATKRSYIETFTRARVEEYERDQKIADPEEGEHDRPEDFLTKFFKKITQDPEKFTLYHLSAGCEAVRFLIYQLSMMR